MKLFHVLLETHCRTVLPVWADDAEAAKQRAVSDSRHIIVAWVPCAVEEIPVDQIEDASIRHGIAAPTADEPPK